MSQHRRWRRRRAQDLPDSLTSVLALNHGERLLAAARDEHTDHWVVVTTWRLLVAAESVGLVVDRPWHEVDAGTWDPDTETLTVTWVGGGARLTWRLLDPGQLPIAFRDRVSASVVLTKALDLGPRRTARVVVRKVLETRELVQQVLLGPRSSREDEELWQAISVTLADLADQVGLDPLGG